MSKQEQEIAAVLTPGRYFFALQPDLTARMQIQQIIKRLPDNPPLQLQTTDNLHQTLVFLGQLSKTQLEQLLPRVQLLYCPPITMQFELISWWSKPKVYCLTCRNAEEALYTLVDQLEKMALAADIAIESRPYQPHITLARKATQTISVPIAPVRFTAKSLLLMKSVATDHGPQYIAVKQWPISIA